LLLALTQWQRAELAAAGFVDDTHGTWICVNGVHGNMPTVRACVSLNAVQCSAVAGCDA
jgi:hypothetical protein